MEELGCQRNNQNSGCPRADCESTTGCTKSSAKSNCQLEPSLADLVLKPKSNKISRPPNAFMLYAREHRKLLASKYPNENNKVISSMLGECWKNVDLRMRKQYFDKAKMLEELHKKQYPGYTYSPRIARMQKLERNRKKSILKCCGRSSHHEEDTHSELSNQAKEEVNMKDDWLKYDHLNRELASPGYIPNNPQYFEESDPTSNPDQNSLPQLQPPNHEHPSYQVPPWHGVPREPFAIPYPRNPYHEYDMRTEAHGAQQYCRQVSSGACSCEVCDKYQNPVCKPLMDHGHLCSDGCNRHYVTPCQNSEKYNLMNLTTSKPLNYQTPIPRPPTYPSNTHFEHSSIPYGYPPYGEFKTTCCALPRTYMAWKSPPYDPSRCCYQEQIPKRNQEHCRTYYNRFAYPPPPTPVYVPYTEELGGRCPTKFTEPKDAPYLNESSSQGREPDEVRLSGNEILNVVDNDEQEVVVVSEIPENDTLEQVNLAENISMQQLQNS